MSAYDTYESTHNRRRAVAILSKGKRKDTRRSFKRSLELEFYNATGCVPSYVDVGTMAFDTIMADRFGNAIHEFSAPSEQDIHSRLRSVLYDVDCVDFMEAF